MFIKTVFILITVLGISSARTSRHMPNYFPKCYRDDPKLNDCLLKATEQVRPYIKKGVPELNMPPLSPFSIPEITLEQGTNSVDYKAALKNVVLRGLENYKFTHFEFDPKTLIFNSTVEINDVSAESDYVVNGKILTVPLDGKGKTTATINTVTASIIVYGKLTKEDTFQFIDVPKIQIKIDFGDAIKYTIDGLFEGNEVLEKAVRKVIDENLKELIEETKPVIENVIIKITEGLLSNSVAQVDIDELFPLHNKE